MLRLWKQPRDALELRRAPRTCFNIGFAARATEITALCLMASLAPETLQYALDRRTPAPTTADFGLAQHMLTALDGQASG